MLRLIFEPLCHWRRWERELLFGATDEELGLTFGNCCQSDKELNLQFKTDSEPALTITHRVFDLPVTTLSFSEVAQYVRLVIDIPKKKSDAECANLLGQKLDEIRLERRNEIKARVRSLTGEPYRCPKRQKKKTSARPFESPSLTDEIANLLFASDCTTEASDRRLLVRLTFLFHHKAQQSILKAAENAVQLINIANSEWRCYTAYWTDQYALPSTYKTANNTSINIRETCPPWPTSG
jgi:hypothetical protein